MLNGSVTQTALKRCTEMFVEKTNVLLDGLISGCESGMGRPRAAVGAGPGRSGRRGEPGGSPGRRRRGRAGVGGSSGPPSQNSPKERAASAELGYLSQYGFLIT